MRWSGRGNIEGTVFHLWEEARAAVRQSRDCGRDSDGGQTSEAEGTRSPPGLADILERASDFSEDVGESLIYFC